MKPLNTLDWTQIVTGFLCGGLGGTILTLLFATRKAKVDTTLKILDTYFDNYDLRNHVKHLFKNPENFLGEDSHERARERNRVREVGNWFEIFAILYKRKVIDRKIFNELDLHIEMQEFVDAVKPHSEIFKPYYVWKNLMNLKLKGQKEIK